MFFQGNEKYNCATYLRLSRSDGDQQESNSIKNQRALLNDYMGKHPELHKFDEYVDDGYSGTNFERPDFKRMMRAFLLYDQRATKSDSQTVQYGFHLSYHPSENFLFDFIAVQEKTVNFGI